MIIVPCHPHDLISLMRVELSAFEIDGYDIVTLNELISRSLLFLKMINPIDMQLVGFAICSNMMGEETEKRTSAAELVMLAIHTHFQGQGYGKHLMKRVIIELEQRGVEIIQLQVKTSNERAIELYKQFGFRIAQTLPNYYDESKEAAYTMLWKRTWKLTPI